MSSCQEENKQRQHRQTMRACKRSTVITLSTGTDRAKAFANSVDPDQMPQNVASDQGLHFLPYIQQYFRNIKR